MKERVPPFPHQAVARLLSTRVTDEMRDIIFAYRYTHDIAREVEGDCLALAQRIKQLEAENAFLTRMINEATTD